VIISAPPDTLNHLLNTSLATVSHGERLPIHGPYHAPHLHARINYDQILPPADSQVSQFLNAYKLAIPLVSTSSGDCFDRCLETTTLLADIVSSILGTTLQIDDVVSGSVHQARANDVERCMIILCGPTKAQDLFLSTLKSETQAKIDICEATSLSSAGKDNDSFRTSRKPKLAIVGMAGRFADAADHEKLWDLLEAGLDVHREASYPLTRISLTLLIVIVLDTQRSL